MAAPNITPGEWEFVEGEPGFMGSLEEPPEPPYPPTVFVSNDDGDFELAQLAEPLYSVEPEDEYDEGLRYSGRTEANGLVMAASKDLLKSATKVWERRGEIFREQTEIDPYSPFGQALLELHNAIKKATGEG